MILIILGEEVMRIQGSWYLVTHQLLKLKLLLENS